ncbi:hypothetical protein ACLPJK_26155 [Pseudomonas aeruginosa]|uniref:hypothetical protein n=1 Tax=Pseudomonas aeruginosa TaxID=287 RepID=UPI003D2A6D4B
MRNDRPDDRAVLVPLPTFFTSERWVETVALIERFTHWTCDEVATAILLYSLHDDYGAVADLDSDLVISDTLSAKEMGLRDLFSELVDIGHDMCLTDLDSAVMLTAEHCYVVEARVYPKEDLLVVFFNE